MVLDKLAGEAEAAGMFATAEECSSYAASAANSAYELTFLFAAFCCIIYVGFIKKQKFTAAQEGPKYLGALCRDSRSVRVYLRTLRHGPRSDLRANHLRILRRVSRMEPDLPEREAFLETLCDDRTGCGRDRDARGV